MICPLLKYSSNARRDRCAVARRGRCLTACHPAPGAESQTRLSSSNSEWNACDTCTPCPLSAMAPCRGKPRICAQEVRLCEVPGQRAHTAPSTSTTNTVSKPVRAQPAAARIRDGVAWSNSSTAGSLAACRTVLLVLLEQLQHRVELAQPRAAALLRNMASRQAWACSRSAAACGCRPQQQEHESAGDVEACGRRPACRNRLQSVTAGSFGGSDGRPSSTRRRSSPNAAAVR